MFCRSVKIRKGEKVVLLFTLLYLLIFTIYYVSIKNYEFLWYVGVVLFFVFLIGSTLEKTKFDYTILWGLTLWGLLHMAGGGVRVGEDVLYAYRIFPFFDGGGDYFILKFDQFVHAFGFGVATLVMYHLLKPGISKGVTRKVTYFAAGAAGMGLGAMNEVVEFIAVLVFPETGVGGYFNTALDLVFNLIGVIVALVFIHIRDGKN
jgi:hypothetical protein